MIINYKSAACILFATLFVAGSADSEDISQNELDDMFEAAYSKIQQEQMVQLAFDRKTTTKAEDVLVKAAFGKTTKNAMNQDLAAEIGMQVTRQLMNTRLARNADPFAVLSKLKAPPRFCPQQALNCSAGAPYRTFDGSCNNQANSWWGQSERPYKRWLTPDYADDLSEPRRSVDGSELPNAQKVACSFMEEKYEYESFVSHMFMQWAQMKNHDITSLSLVFNEEEAKVSNCGCEVTPKCFPIMLNNDGYTCNCPNSMTKPCLPFKRASATFPDPDCTIGRREQISLVSSFLDASSVYGENEAKNKKLRLGFRGLMRLQKNGLLPQEDETDDCREFKPAQKCFMAGDDRVNQNPGLMSIQTLMIREHNRIALKLSEINPTWNDNTVFEEARRVLVAFQQHITMAEYAPILLGPQVAPKHDLLPRPSGQYFTQYNPQADPRIANEWAAAAGRFGHSIIRGRWSRLDKDYNATFSSMMLRTQYFHANSLYSKCSGGLESVMRGMLVDPIGKADPHAADDITKHLFERFDDAGKPVHANLFAINVQRGRDVGVPSYIKFREFCMLPPYRTWTELASVMSAESVSALKKNYKFVDDIDLFVAMLHEKRLSDALVGQTLACLLAHQLKNIKYSDSFWYETDQEPARFTISQLNEIRKITLAKILCRNLENTPKIQTHAMLTTKLTQNKLVECSSLPDINWSLWKV